MEDLLHHLLLNLLNPPFLLINTRLRNYLYIQNLILDIHLGIKLVRVTIVMLCTTLNRLDQTRPFRYLLNVIDKEIVSKNLFLRVVDITVSHAVVHDLLQKLCNCVLKDSKLTSQEFIVLEEEVRDLCVVLAEAVEVLVDVLEVVVEVFFGDFLGGVVFGFLEH